MPIRGRKKMGLYRKLAGLGLAALLIATHPLLVYYSQEARMYMLLALEAAALFWLLLALGIKEYRQVFFKPYRMIYRVIGKQVYIHLIVDGRRDMQSVLARRLLGA